MSTRQTYNNFDNLTGRTLGTLQVGQLARKSPNVAWQAQCIRCGSSGTYAHQKLTTDPSCLNRGCGRNGLREELDQTPRKFREKIQAAKRAEIEKLESDFNDLTRKIALAQREGLLTGADKKVYIAPEIRTASMTLEEAQNFNIDQAQIFKTRNPSFYPCQENIETLSGYLERNGIDAIVDASTLEAAYKRLDEFGLMKHEAVAPTPVPVAVNLELDRPPEPKVEPEPLMGYDLRTGEHREFTSYEVDRMSADQYRRTFRIYKDKLALPNHAAF